MDALPRLWSAAPPSDATNPQGQPAGVPRAMVEENRMKWCDAAIACVSPGRPRQRSPAPPAALCVAKLSLRVLPRAPRQGKASSCVFRVPDPRVTNPARARGEGPPAPPPSFLSGLLWATARPRSHPSGRGEGPEATELSLAEVAVRGVRW